MQKVGEGYVLVLTVCTGTSPTRRSDIVLNVRDMRDVPVVCSMLNVVGKIWNENDLGGRMYICMYIRTLRII